MDLQEYQRRIDQVQWYHEFDFPNGLVARSKTVDITFHRRFWTFIQQKLDKIDFAGKTVLDIGCWDGYWSFYAERRGAKSVLAADDQTQNWGTGSGILLAKELLNSSIEIQLDVSIYDLEKLQRKFDIVLCLGVYYHLVDPFYAFSQLRHCCHNGSLAVFEGDGTFGLEPPSIYYDLSDPSKPMFVPTMQTLRQMLEANYFRLASLENLHGLPPSLAQPALDPPPPPPVTPLAELRRALKVVLGIGSPPPPPPPLPPEIAALPLAQRLQTRFVAVAEAIETVNPLHHYRPPFGLHRYDERFRDAKRSQS